MGQVTAGRGGGGKKGGGGTPPPVNTPAPVNNPPPPKPPFKFHAGQTVTALGIVVLIGIIIHTAVVVYGRQEPKCEANPVRPPTAGMIVYSPQSEISMNNYLCVGWQPKLLFKAENDLRVVKAAALKAAQVDEAKAQEAANAATDPTTVTNATAALKVVQARLAQADADLQALPTVATLAVFIDGHPSPITYEAAVVDTEGWAWQSHFVRAPEDASSDEGKAWRTLLSGGGLSGLRVVRVNLDVKDAKIPRNDAVIDNLKLRILSPGWVFSGAAAFIAMATGLVMWGWDTGMLRGSVPTSDNPKPQFSLGRVQMAWWFALSLAGFLYVWLLTGQWMSVFTMSVVSLVGISGASGAAAMAIDSGTTAAPSTGNFFKDLTSAGGSVVLHRVQMLIWTIVLGLIFIWSVIYNFAFPAFDNSLLVLAGLVNGVYVGFKFPEQNLPPPAATG